MKVLIVEDDPSLREIMQTFLERQGYVVEMASDFMSGMEKTDLYSYDCILLDIMLGNGNGLDILEELKNQGKKECVIIISAKDSIDDKVRGLELGADDYLTKPFHLDELNARIKSVVRRNTNNGSMTIDYGNIKIFPDKKTVYVDGRQLELGRKEFDILYYFMTRTDRLISKDVLAEAIWGDNIDQVDNFDFIYAQIKNLRKKLKDAGASAEIKAIYGFGYKISLIDNIN